MTEHREDETLTWAREIASDLGGSVERDEEVHRATGATDPETDVLDAMANLPEHWKRHIADIAQGIAEEVTEQPGAVPSAGRHRSPNAS